MIGQLSEEMKRMVKLNQAQISKTGRKAEKIKSILQKPPNQRSEEDVEWLINGLMEQKFFKDRKDLMKVEDIKDLSNHLNFLELN